jgi:hypothetical protein
MEPERSILLPTRINNNHSSWEEYFSQLSIVSYQEDQNLIEVGGRVLREDYDRAKAANKRVKEMLLDMADNEQQKALYEKIWPY